MADRSVTIRLKVEMAGFQTAMARASAQAASAAKSTEAAWVTTGRSVSQAGSGAGKGWKDAASVATSAASAAGKGWADAGATGIVGAAKLKGAWDGIQVPGVTGAKLVSTAWSGTGDGAAVMAQKVKGAWTGIQVPGVTGAKLVSSEWQATGTATAGVAGRVRSSWTGVQAPAVAGAQAVSTAWNGAGSGAQTMASKVKGAWTGIQVPGVTGAHEVDAAWSTSGGAAATMASKVKGAWTGISVPGVTGAKAVASEWSATGEVGARSASGLGGIWSRVSDGAAAAAGRVKGAWSGVGTMVDGLIQKQQAHEEAWRQVSTAALVGGGAIVAGIGVAVAKYAEFDQAMSNVKADTHESAENMNKLRDAAVKAGADTAYSATDAAGAIDELAKAGVSTADILGGGLNGALSLAAAGQLDVGEAAETAASAMTQFGLKGSDLNHVADLLAAGAGKAQGSVHDMGEALNQVGLIASQSGLSIEETTGGLAAFASAGLTGSDAGTSFKTMLQRLQNPSSEASDLLNDLGVSMYDSQGKFVGLANLAGQLHTAMDGMSEGQRNAAMATIFGSDAVRGANVLYSQGQEGIQGWIDKVNDTGYAAETAAAKQDNLRGDLEKLGGSIETVFLESGSGANDFLRSIVQAADGAVDAFSRIPAPVLATGTAIAGIGGGALLAVGGFMKIISFASQAGAAFSTLKGWIDSAVQRMGGAEAASSRLSGAMGGLLKVAGGASVALAGLSIMADISRQMEGARIGVEGMTNAMADASVGLSALNDQFKNADWANGNGNTFWDGTVEGVNSASDALVRLQNLSVGDRFDAWGAAGLGFSNATNEMKDDISNLDQSLANMASGGHMEQAQQNFKSLMDQVKSSGGNVEEAAASFPKLKAAVEEYASAQGVTLSEQEKLDAMMGKMPESLAAAAGGADQAKAGIEGMGQAAGDTKQSLEDIVKSLQALGLANQSVAESTGQFSQDLRDMQTALQQNSFSFDTMTGMLDTTTESGWKAQQAIDKFAKSGWAMAEATAKAGGSLTDVQGNLQSTYSGLVNTGTQFGLTGAQAEEMARNVMGIPKDVSVQSWMSDTASKMAQQTAIDISKIPENKWTTIKVDAQGSPQAVQAQIDSIHGAEPKVLVTDQGTTKLTQQQINDIYGKTTKVAVTDDGTVYHVQGKINGVTDGDADIIVGDRGTIRVVQSGINSTQGKNVNITAVPQGFQGVWDALNSIPAFKTVSVVVSTIGKAAKKFFGGATGGAVADVAAGLAGRPIPGYATGGLLPGRRPANPHEDNLRALVGDTGQLIGVQSSEFITNSAATKKNLAWLERMNDGLVMDDFLRSRGLSVGGTVAPSGQVNAKAALPVQQVRVGEPRPTGGPELGQMQAAFAAAVAQMRPVVSIGGRDFYGVIESTQRQYGSRR